MTRYYFIAPTGKQQAEPVITKSLTLSPGPYKVGDTITATFTIRNDGVSAVSFTNLTVGGRYSSQPFQVGDGKLPFGDFPDFPHRSVHLSPGDSFLYRENLVVSVPGYYHFFCAYSPYYGDSSNWNSNIPSANSNVISSNNT